MSELIKNVRLGFATNSSSTHSIVFVGSDVVKDEDVQDEEFGWQFFTAHSSRSKIAYLAHVVYENLTDVVGERSAAIVAESLTGHKFTRNKGVDIEGYIDHQSVLSLPRSYDAWSQNDIDHDFVEDLKQWMLRSDIAILGGNDNDDNLHPLLGRYSNAKSETGLVKDDYKRKFLVCRKEGDGKWTLFNRETGCKIQVSFNGGPVVPLTPELVDLKITDFCPFNCSWCVVPETKISTLDGPVAIALLKEGDTIYTFDHKNNTTVQTKVSQVFERDYSGDLIIVETENGEIRLTPEHEVFTSNRGYIKACDLNESDELISI